MATRAKAPTTEREIRRYFVKRVKEAGGEVRKVNWQGRRSAPDELALFPHPDFEDLGATGFSAFVELKRPGKRPTPAQWREIERLAAAGQDVFWINSYEQVDGFIWGAKEALRS